MAFKILSEEEKLFMTEKQLEIYENELRLYKERLAFVEKVEKLEGAEIKKFTPSLRNIGAVSSPELAPFENKGIGRIELNKTAVRVQDTSLYAARTISKTDITGFIKATMLLIMSFIMNLLIFKTFLMPFATAEHPISR